MSEENRQAVYLGCYDALSRHQPTLRDQFAMSCVQLYLRIYDGNWNKGSPEDVAAYAYKYADAMLAERNKQK